MSLIRTLGGIASAAAAPPVGGTPANSLSLDAASTQYMDWTPATSFSGTQATVSFWYKNTINGSNQISFSTSDSASGGSREYSNVDNGGWTRFWNRSAYATKALYWGNQTYDVWRHMFVHIDVDNANQVFEGWLSNDYASDTLNTDHILSIGDTILHAVGANTTAATPWNGLIYDFHIVTGSLVPLSSFAEDVTGTWSAKPYEGPWGTHGINLRFDNAGDLGEDNANLQTVTVHNTPTQSVDLPPRTDA